MIYTIVSGCESQYSYTPFRSIRTLQYKTYEEAVAEINYYKELLAQGYSCIHISVHSVDEDTGAIEVLYNQMTKVPLKQRKEINKRTVTGSSAIIGKSPTTVIFDDFLQGDIAA